VQWLLKIRQFHCRQPRGYHWPPLWGAVVQLSPHLLHYHYMCEESKVLLPLKHLVTGVF
jgi:hypothetical protein